MSALIHACAHCLAFNYGRRFCSDCGTKLDHNNSPKGN